MKNPRFEISVYGVPVFDACSVDYIFSELRERDCPLDDVTIYDNDTKREYDIFEFLEVK